MKFKTIQWQNHPDYPLVYQGMIGDQELFTITDITGRMGRKESVTKRF